MNKVKSVWHKLKTGLMSSAIRAQNADILTQANEPSKIVESLPVVETLEATEREDETEQAPPTKVSGAVKKKPGRPKGTASSKKVSD